MKKSLHIVSFDVPYPPNYGGIIDVFYKIVELHKLDIDIYLHTYLYNGKSEQQELQKYCKKVFYYKRRNSFISLFSILPFRLISRKNNQLIKNINAIKAPILFEGLQTTYPINAFKFTEKVFVRAHNIEHDYFFGLAKSEQQIFKKVFFYTEALKLKIFEKQLKKATGILTISPYEQNYFASAYGEKCNYIPAFHDVKLIKDHSIKGEYILYHGDLRISDNIKAALFLIEVYKNSSYRLVIASSENSSIINEINKHPNIDFKTIDNQDELELLFRKAHINTLITFQKTGIKLKLLNALYKGKFIIANSKMITDTGLESLCEFANTKEQILEKTEVLLSKEFSESEIEKRMQKLKSFSPSESAKKIVAIIFK